MKYIVCIFFLSCLFVTNQTYAVRPFITDDARVVGPRFGQLEGWFRFDRHAWQQWDIFAYGPTKWLEVSAGGVWGYELPTTGERLFTYAAPLLQAKVLIRECQANKLPGVAVATGTFIPTGMGAFKSPGAGAFGYLAVSQSFIKGDKILLHGNIGVNYLNANNKDVTAATWGFGTQINLYKGLHVVGELFSGDPYVSGASTAYQAGFRYFISDLVQADMTVGEGITGAAPMPFWYSIGIRLVTEKFRKRK